ncbi:NAD+ synthase [Laribacter hongkongensis]|uniref:Glutamine-dependent NAD(+) synthetase n=1 Tax=Laribacter hongkongensis TaxID=168471 RepID=A0A248LID8_9NEIS|nr:NAD+ synthase [Laribacter hongkongensis]ASJ24259.1 NAD+ synthase [Laribacter hongkongensis]MCG9040210.1 NAD+ synthase [Laribacter hongkongensis]MCG9067674.1 NAD+ synthase [Laribacter hongkongensis]MCG9088624.1 NAD+ synthase [Laribacter hongkongensis]MCG9110075.1 NAD+ synthase [Laribacter hongkongensis]
MRLALAQFNPIVGDIAGNANEIARLAREAMAAGADVLLTPELALTGYSPEDLLLRPAFYAEVNRQLDRLMEIDGITLIIGHPAMLGSERFNAATVMRDGNILGTYHKMRLPNEEVFDEVRYFTPGVAPLVFGQDGVNIGVLVCEDIWGPEPAAEALDAGADVLLVMNASPFHREKHAIREQECRWRVEETGLPVAYVNLVGGQDELVFDGASFALNRAGEPVCRLPHFEAALGLLDVQEGDIRPAVMAPLPDPVEAVYRALVLGVRDYIGKNGFPGVLLGLSGGIDSALTLAIAVDALGADRVHAVMMPSRYTADISVDDSRDMVERLGVRYDEVAIWPMYESFMQALTPLFAGAAADTTEENLQSRIRGVILMALSNKTGKLVLTTGNKSEMTTGYATLYGDMAGGFAVLKDVAKTLVYELSEWRNRQGSEVIPRRIIDRAPSAELRPDQVDQDSLPPYDVLDAIMAEYVEMNRSAADIVALGYDTADVERVTRLLKVNEYKRRQAPVGPRITHRAFGKDWRYPITNRFR